MLPISMRSAIIALLFKKGDVKFLKNYRPISLSNSDYKILAFVLAERLQKVISSIVSEDQTAYIRQRFIGTSARTIIDVMEYCSKFNEEGILLCLDFEKAFDSLEWSFLFKVLETLNFGDYFISWIKILYTEPLMMFKNNGWISSMISPTRGIRQGCPISALLFILVVEVMAVKIRSSDSIRGVSLNNIGKSIKLKQYADDATLILKDMTSIDYAIRCISEFGELSGLRLNIQKTEGILLGSLKNSKKSVSGISFTNKAVRCLGVYIGHDYNECYLKNWTDKLDFFEQTLERWKKRQLTLFGRILILKTLGLSKFVYLFNILTVPNEIIIKITSLMFKFLWDGKDKVRRNVVIAPEQDGGLNMVNLYCFVRSLQAAWGARIVSGTKCTNIFLEFYAKKLGLTVSQLFLSNVCTDQYNDIALILPKFYCDVLYSFNKAKLKKNITQMSSIDFLRQPVFYNENFMWHNKVLYFPNWCRSDLFLICDLFDSSGNMYDSNAIIQKLQNRSNWISEYSIIKKVVSQKVSKYDVDTSLSKYVNKTRINAMYMMTIDGVIDVSNVRSDVFYKIMIKDEITKPNAELYWNNRFSLNVISWQNIYNKRVKKLQDRKIAEFNFKLLHRIVPCGLSLSKWNHNISERCCYCNEVESIEHMLFNCTRVQRIWNIVNTMLSLKMNVKYIVIGFPYSEYSEKEYCISVVAYFIYKTWLLYSLKRQGNFPTCDLKLRVKNELFWKIETLKYAGKYIPYRLMSKLYRVL